MAPVPGVAGGVYISTVCRLLDTIVCTACSLVGIAQPSRDTPLAHGEPGFDRDVQSLTTAAPEKRCRRSRRTSLMPLNDHNGRGGGESPANAECRSSLQGELRRPHTRGYRAATPTRHRARKTLFGDFGNSLACVNRRREERGVTMGSGGRDFRARAGCFGWINRHVWALSIVLVLGAVGVAIVGSLIVDTDEPTFSPWGEIYENRGTRSGGVFPHHRRFKARPSSSTRRAGQDVLTRAALLEFVTNSNAVTRRRRQSEPLGHGLRFGSQYREGRCLLDR